jgi:hypothetical protein
LEFFVDTGMSSIEIDQSKQDQEASMTATSIDGLGVNAELREFSPKALRRARIAAGDYARSNGMYDPVDVLAFTQLCIEHATGRVNATTFDASEALVKEVVRIASTSCGVCRTSEAASVVKGDTNSSEPVVAAPTSVTASFVASVAECAPVIAVPPVHQRAMPPQPLGELPDVRPARLWMSLLQTTKRATWSALSALFARSE